MAFKATKSKEIELGKPNGRPPNTRVLNKKVIPLKPAAKKQEGKSALLTVDSKGFRRAHGASARSLIRLAYHILYCTSGLIQISEDHWDAFYIYPAEQVREKLQKEEKAYIKVY